jgi:hypothetical protein
MRWWRSGRVRWNCLATEPDRLTRPAVTNLRVLSLFWLAGFAEFSAALLESPAIALGQGGGG